MSEKRIRQRIGRRITPGTARRKRRLYGLSRFYHIQKPDHFTGAGCKRKFIPGLFFYYLGRRNKAEKRAGNGKTKRRRKPETAKQRGKENVNDVHPLPGPERRAAEKMRKTFLNEKWSKRTERDSKEEKRHSPVQCPAVH